MNLASVMLTYPNGVDPRPDRHSGQICGRSHAFALVRAVDSSRHRGQLCNTPLACIFV